MKPFVLIALITISIFSGLQVSAQKDSTSAENTVIKIPPFFTYSVGLEYGNTKTFKGHVSTSSIQQYVSPYFTVNTRWGLFANIGGTKVLGDSVGWDETDFGVGYETKILGKNKVSLSYTHSIFSSSSSQLNSGLYNNLDFYFKRPLFKVLTTKLSFDYSYGDTTDFNITWQNAYPNYFEDVFKDGDEISLIPKVYMYFGSQNYYAKFSKFFNKPNVSQQRLQRLIKEYRKKNPKATQAEAKTAVDKEIANNQPTPADKSSSKFTMTSINLSLPLSYTIGKYFFEFNPSYTISVNKPTYIPLDVDSPPQNFFSFTITIGADF